MIFRLAKREELPDIKKMFEEIVTNMYQNNIRIWNQYYPFMYLEEDIEKQRLYVLEEEGTIVACCAICDSHEAEKKIRWKDKEAKAKYIDRLGVNVNYQGKGYGSLLIHHVAKMAKENGSDYLRLFVVDCNQPAICLYEKNKFERLPDIYQEKVTEEITLVEYVYEKKV